MTTPPTPPNDTPEDKTLEAKLERITSLQEQTLTKPILAADPSDLMPAQRFRSFPQRSLAFVQTREWKGPAAAKARELLPFILHDGIMVLHGDRGTGKTCMATWWATEKGRGMYVKALDLFNIIRSTMFGTRDRRSNERDTLRVVEKFRASDFLVIDEAHERGETDFEDRTLVNLIDHRYDAMLPTVLIGNLTQEATIQSLGPSITRRINQTGGFVHCNWPPYTRI